MKQAFLFIAASLLMLMAANAQKSDKLIVPAGSIQQFAFGEGMKVVLVKATPTENNGNISLEVLQKLNVHFTNGTLELSPRRSLKDETVYVLVSGVQSISAGENTTVESDDIFASSHIDLYMNAGSTARLKTAGSVSTSSPADVDVTVKRTFLTSSEASGIN